MAHRCHTEVIAHVPEDLQYMLSLAAGKAERDRINNIILRDTCMQCEHRDGYENIQPHRVSFLATTVPSLQYCTCLLAWNLSSLSEIVLLSHDLEQIDACPALHPDTKRTLPCFVPNTQDRAVRKLAKTTQGCRCCRRSTVPIGTFTLAHLGAGGGLVSGGSARPVSDVAAHSASE